jgi:hypothetical protein
MVTATTSALGDGRPAAFVAESVRGSEASKLVRRQPLFRVGPGYGDTARANALDDESLMSPVLSG